MADEDPAYVAFIRQQKCRLWMNDPCDGGVQPHHAGPRPFGRRAHDDTCIPLCAKHHAAWHDLQPPFRGWSRDERRAWVAKQIRRMRLVWKRYLSSER